MYNMFCFSQEPMTKFMGIILGRHKTKKAPQTGGFCGAKGLWFLALGGKNEELCSVDSNITNLVINVKQEKCNN